MKVVVQRICFLFQTRETSPVDGVTALSVEFSL